MYECISIQLPILGEINRNLYVPPLFVAQSIDLFGKSKRKVIATVIKLNFRIIIHN